MDSHGTPVPGVPEQSFIVSHQKVELDVDFATQTLSGRCEITILPQTKELSTIQIDARQCVIPSDGVMVNGRSAEFEYEDPMKALNIPEFYAWGAEQFEMQRDRLKPLADEKKMEGTLLIELPPSVRIEQVDPFSENAANVVTQRALGAAAARLSSTGIDGINGPASATSTLTPKTAAEKFSDFQPLTITISFTTKNFRDGLHWVGLGEADQRYPHIYTRHSYDRGTASCIFPCVDDPAMRCTWEISIRCSRTLGDALKRRPSTRREHRLQQIMVKKGLVTGIIEEIEVSLSDEEKLLDVAVVCSGELMNEVTDPEDSSKKIVSFLCSAVVAPQHIGFAVGPFEQVDLSEYREEEDDEKLGQGQTVPVIGYCLPGRADEVRHTCMPMAHALDWFLLNFGGYPFTDCRFVFVDDQIRNAEHTTSLSICSSRLLFGEDIIDPEIENTRTLVHAIASQWIGVSVVPNQRVDRWITVGLSHFMTDLFMKSLCGHNEYAFRQKVLSDRLVELDIDRPSLLALGETLQLGSFEYDFMALKAPLVLFILDRRIIKASGTTGLTRVISKIITTANTGTTIDSVLSTDSFRKTTEKITKYRQTESFWNQWILGAGCPRFSISQKFNKKRLCVEMTISQKQDTLPTQRKLEGGCFMREFKEDINGVYAGDLQPVFTGPLTIRIHEADGTPYEHIVEIREGISKIEIPYNTKYKRLKRSRRQKERQNAGIVDPAAEGGEDALYYCLGDVLQSPAEMADWGLVDWDQDAELRMDQESYEWVRVDADFEWICEKSFVGMPAYMYVSQLQQDRDVVAQQESMLYLKNMNAHPLVSTFLIRTLMDTRYFHGIRTMAAEFLKNHATTACNWAGLRHLEKAYQEFFCYPGSKMPRSNDFSDKRSYKVEMAISQSLSKVRGTDGRCPKEARQFLLDMLRFNDNTNNEYSDNFKIANLLSCLAHSLIPEKDSHNVLNRDDEEDDEDSEPKQYKNAVIEELDRYRRMDEWINSHQNVFTLTVLECKKRLMKAKVIPMAPLEFAQYLHDGTSDDIRIQAFKHLIVLGHFTNNSVAALLLNVLSTDPSPYTRKHLFEVFCLGLATIAFGEDKRPATPPAADARNEAAVDGSSELAIEGEAHGGLVIEQEADLDARKAQIARTTSIEGALAALKGEMKDNLVLKTALWKAIKSTSLNFREQWDLLDICFILYDAVESNVVRLRYPRYWKVDHLGKGILLFTTTEKFRIKPSKPMLTVLPPKPTQLASKLSHAPLRLSLSTGATAGAMRPPKRPPPSEPTLSHEARPRKIVKLKIGDKARLSQIQNSPPNLGRQHPSSSVKCSSPGPRPSPAPRPSSAIPQSPVLSNYSVSPAPMTSVGTPGLGGTPPVKPARKPLPDSGRKPLPDSAPRPHIEPTPPSAPRKFLLKLKTNIAHLPQ